MRESQLLEYIYQANVGLPSHVTIGPGDDMGQVNVGGVNVLVTVDQVIDGVHFDLRTTAIQKVGRKAVTRNLSDVAAMAATPIGAVVAACLPGGFGQGNGRALVDAMRDVAEAFGCPLFGGDIAVTGQVLIVTVTVLAHCPAHGPVLRGGAKAGDLICVSGELGGSMVTCDGYTHHLDFEPRVALGQTLGRMYQPHCMIDLSDGLGKDLAHLCRASGLCAVVDAARLPICAVVRDEPDAWRRAMGDGEDYELCFTVDAGQQVPDVIDGVPIRVIGKMIECTGDATATVAVKLANGQYVDARALGWEHSGELGE